MFTLVNYKLKLMLSYFVNEILGNSFRYNSTLEHRRTKWTKKCVPHGRFSKIYYFKENQNFSTTPPNMLTENKLLEIFYILSNVHFN